MDDADFTVNHISEESEYNEESDSNDDTNE